MTIPAIQTQNLSKVFGNKVAVADLTLTVEQGEVFGFLGPNGAGKTTSVKMLLGLVHPTAGEGQLLGHSLGDPAGREQVGFLPEHFRFHDWLKAREFLQLHADLYHVPRAVARQRIPHLLARVGLSAHAGRKLRTFSKGMLQRLGLAQALLNTPQLVFLDEPTSGLDPVGRRLVRDIIRELREQGTTVFLNSHLLSEVEITCDRVAFIHHGSIIRTAQLRAEGGMVVEELEVRIRARLRGGAGVDGGGKWPTVLAGLQRWSESVPHVPDNGAVVEFALSLASEDVLPEINRYLVGQGVDVYTLVPQRLSLEELFVRLVGEDRDL